MLDGLLIGLVVLGALSCPLMMLLGRRGIGPGCAFMRCKPPQRESLEDLRAQQRALGAQIDRLESSRAPHS